MSNVNNFSTSAPQNQNQEAPILSVIKNYKVLIFDFDETLVRLTSDWHLHTKSLKQMFPEVVKKYQNVLDKENINYITMRNAIVDFYGHTILPKLSLITEDFEMKRVTSIDYNHNLINIVRDLCGKKEMYIWSGNCTAIIRKVLKDLDILDCFEKLITQDTLTYLKPYPEGFTQIYNDVNLLSDYLLIGDSENDEQAANASGIAFYRIDFFKVESPKVIN